jgi:hypothetical protein
MSSALFLVDLFSPSLSLGLGFYSNANPGL